MAETRHQLILNEKTTIVGMHFHSDQPVSINTIAMCIGLPKSTVQGVVEHFCDRENLVTPIRSGRPPKVNAAGRHGSVALHNVTFQVNTRH